MKKILYSALVAIVMIACQKYPEPEYVVPTYELKEYQTLISIEELKARHTLGGTPTAIMGDTVIRGIVLNHLIQGMKPTCLVAIIISQILTLECHLQLRGIQVLHSILEVMLSQHMIM